MEKLSYELVDSLSDIAEARVIAWGGSQRWLPLFLVYAFFRALVEMSTRRPDVLHLGDPVMCLVGVPLGRLFRVPTVVTVHGLDITYPARWYQSIVVRLVAKCACVICISESVLRECERRGIQQKATVIPPGIDPAALPTASERSRETLRTKIGPYGSDRVILLTVGRLVRRKGVARFIREILPGIVARRRDVLYLVVGDGPDRSHVEAAVSETNMSDYVHIMGRVPAETLAAVYEATTLFVMPNQPVPGDMEGFGLVALEANLFGLPVVASELEGIIDALEPGQNGYLVQWDDSQIFADIITELFDDTEKLGEAGQQALQYVEANFSWDKIARQYLTEFDAVSRGNDNQ